MCGKYFFFVGMALFATACYPDIFFTPSPPEPRVKAFPNVDRELWPHFETFEKEAAQRGLRINLARTNISATFRDIDRANVAGMCSYGGQHNRITIDRPFWNRASHLSREMIVFHELGHCYLNRDHTEATFASGFCQSIMRSGTCCCRDAYSLQNRSYYLDELFGKASQ